MMNQQNKDYKRGFGLFCYAGAVALVLLMWVIRNVPHPEAALSDPVRWFLALAIAGGLVVIGWFYRRR